MYFHGVKDKKIAPINIFIGDNNGRVSRIRKKSKFVLGIRAHKTARFWEYDFPEEIRQKYVNKLLTLDDLFEFDERAYIKIIAYGYDSYSGARKYFESKKYFKDDIIEKKYRVETEKSMKRLKVLHKVIIKKTI